MPIISSLTTGIVYDAGDVATPQVIDNDLGVGDGEQDWNGGSFVVSGLLAGDTVSIDTSGAFSIIAGDLYFSGGLIGTVSGGVGGDLVVTFTTANANDNAIIEELLEALRFSSTVPLIVTRTLTYTLTDAAANVDARTVDIGITGDADDNHLKGTAGANTIDGAGGNDLLRGEGDNDILVGAGGNDNLVGGIGDDTLDGGADNDTMNGGAGDDDMDGGDGNDTYYVDSAGDVVLESPAEGTDTVRSTIAYTLGAEVENLILSGAADQGHGNGGANTITGNATLGDDLRGQAGDDTLNGQGGNDSLYGGEGLDTLNGGTGNDALYGEDDNDVLRGGAGDDSLDGGFGADDMDGGVGNDIYYVDDAGDVVGETVANGGTDEVYSLVNFTLSANIENISLMGGDDINATGNTLANSITGNTGENVLDGGGGNDTLNGGDDDDTLVGGAGNDSLTGGAGDDDMSGGIGDDTYYVDSNGDVIAENSGEGTDTAYASLDYALGAGVYVENLRANAAFGLVLDGNELDNRIYGGGFDDTLEGFGGNDRLDGGLGEDIMIGGLGDDIYYVDDQDDEVIEFGGEGTDTVRVTLANYYADDNVELIYGLSNLGQRLGGNSLNNRIEGADGDDILAGGDGDDILLGGLGADRLNGNAGDDSMRGGDGNDTYWVDEGDIIVENLNEGIDTIYTTLDWTIDDNVENLIMTGGDDLVAGGNALNNVMTGNIGWNDLYGDAGDDTLNGGGGDDYLFGEGDDDILNGGAGDDLLDGGEGADTMNGAQGDDQIFVDDIGDVTLDTGGGIDFVLASVDHTIGAGIEVLYLAPLAGDIDGTGNSGNNLIWGNEGDNVLSGLGGHDALTGDEGEDTLYGGDGDDFLDDGFDDDVDYMYGGAGRDQLVGSVGDFLYGGVGNDEYSITEDGINIIEYDAEGYDTVFSQITYTLTDYVERLDLSCAGGDIDGTGNAQVNTIIGNCHANVLDGAGGNDVLYGSDGDDTLIGGLGNDRMSGEAGSDTFIVRNADIVSSVLGQTRQADIILDLDFDDGDRIDLSDVDADINTGGDQDFVFVSTFSKQAGEARLSYNDVNDTTLLQLDVDGDGKADYQVSLYGDHTGGNILDGSEPVGTGGWVGFMAVT